jgi:hypothetical protein
MKSILISSHFHVGIGKDCNGPAVFMYMALTRLQVSHLDYLSLLGGRQLCNFTQTESDAPSWVKHTERGLPTSGCSKSIVHETGVNVK